MKNKNIALLIIFCLCALGGIAQIEIEGFDCVDPTNDTGFGTVRIKVGAQLNDLPQEVNILFDNCSSQFNTNSLAYSFGDFGSSYIYFIGTSEDGECLESFTGKLQLIELGIEHPVVGISDGEVTGIIDNPAEYYLSSNQLASFCNSNIKEFIDKSLSNGNLQAEDCFHWKGECGIDEPIWREGRLMSGGVAQNCFPDVLLAIDATVLTEEFMTCNDNISWCDYVFEEDYNLMPLKEVKEYIKKNRRLPNVPSEASIIAAGGLELPDIIIKQQEKIEELFLYAIQLNKKLQKIQSHEELKTGFKENIRYGIIKKETPKVEDISIVVPPQDPCMSIDCEALIEDESGILEELVISQLNETSCKKWTGGCIGGVGGVNLLKRTGAVGIGTNEIPAGFKLAVNSEVMFESLYLLLCEEYSWCDYVFEDSYSRPNFAELEKFIINEKRLPNVPSSKTIMHDGGILLRQVTILQQEKIEELYLYLIDLNNRIKKIKTK